jgi:hypothetical protein
MRWVFFSLLILNVVYLVVGLVLKTAPPPKRLAAPSAVVAPESLVLLREARPEGVSGRLAPAGMPPLCPVAGPWLQRSDADRARHVLVRAGYQVSVETLRVARDRLHWVYLSPADTREAALRTLRELQARRVDSFIVAEGEDVNAISLGYFSNADSARGLMVKMQAAGYQAQVRETAREAIEYWLHIDGDSIADGGEALRALLAAEAGVSGTHVACRSAAPPTTGQENISVNP